jgi:hypothetical protein
MNVAAKTLGVIHETLRIDEEWTARRDRGFTWWAYRFAHHVDAGRPVQDDGVALTRITSRVAILRDVRAADEQVEARLARQNFLADSYCYVFDPKARTIDSVQSHIVHEQVLDWRPRLLASQFLIQLIHAEEQARDLAKSLDARLAVSNHPLRGRRWRPDEMLGAVREVILPGSSGVNRFADQFEFDTIYEEAQKGNAASLGATGTGLCVELAFGTGTALLTLDALGPHPLIGQGLGVFIQLPIQADFEGCARLAAWLNRKEAAGELLAPGIGAWSARKHGQSYVVAHMSFIPNVLHQQGLSIDAARTAAIKIRAVNALLNPGVPEPAVWEVVAKRLGLKLPVESEGGRVKLSLPN